MPIGKCERLEGVTSDADVRDPSRASLKPTGGTRRTGMDGRTCWSTSVRVHVVCKTVDIIHERLLSTAIVSARHRHSLAPFNESPSKASSLFTHHPTCTPVKPRQRCCPSVSIASGLRIIDDSHRPSHASDTTPPASYLNEIRARRHRVKRSRCECVPFPCARPHRPPRRSLPIEPASPQLAHLLILENPAPTAKHEWHGRHQESRH